MNEDNVRLPLSTQLAERLRKVADDMLRYFPRDAVILEGASVVVTLRSDGVDTVKIDGELYALDWEVER